jgi:hypothetical protein
MPQKSWERANIVCDADSTIFVSSHPPTFVAITLRAALVAAAEAEVRTFRLTACAAALLRACLKEGGKNQRGARGFGRSTRPRVGAFSTGKDARSRHLARTRVTNGPHKTNAKPHSRKPAARHPPQTWVQPWGTAPPRMLQIAQPPCKLHPGGGGARAGLQATCRDADPNGPPLPWFAAARATIPQEEAHEDSLNSPSLCASSGPLPSHHIPPRTQPHASRPVPQGTSLRALLPHSTLAARGGCALPEETCLALSIFVVAAERFFYSTLGKKRN